MKIKDFFLQKNTIVFWVFLALYSSFYKGYSQESLVPNPGFEKFYKTSDGHSYLENVYNWFNIVLDRKAKHYATPDHLYDTDVHNLRKYRNYFSPKNGLSSGGIITYMKRLRNYREYLSVKLIKPLSIGKEYAISMYVCNGVNGNTFGNIAASGLGCFFSLEKPKQQTYEPLNVKAQFVIKEKLYFTDWQKIVGIFKPEEKSQFLTIGNFNTDNRTIIEELRYDIDPQAYFFIDDVKLKKIPSPISQFKIIKPSISKKIKTVNKKVTIKNNQPPVSLKGKFVYQQNKIQINKDIIILKLWDGNKVDGDIISLRFNEKWILNKYTLSKKKKRIKLIYNKESNNLLILFAHNLGKEPPNTAKFSLRTKQGIRKISLRSDLGKCGALKIER